MFNGIDNSVSGTLLDHPSSVTYSFNTLSGTGAVPHPATPTLTSPIVGNSTGLYAVSGTLQASSVDIYNLSLDFYLRDSSGLLRDKKSAFPGNLGTILAGTQTPFATNGSADAFSRYVYFPKFIQGVSPNAVSQPQAAQMARSQLLSDRFAEVARARVVPIHR